MIVNTTSKDLKLGNGAVSASLLKAGGNILQQECDQNHPNGIQHGEIAVTSGGNLSCQFICHGSLPGWDQKGVALRVCLGNLFVLIIDIYIHFFDKNKNGHIFCNDINI